MTKVYVVTERLYDYRSDDNEGKSVDNVVAVFGTRDGAEQWIATAKVRTSGKGRRGKFRKVVSIHFDIHEHSVQ